MVTEAVAVAEPATSEGKYAEARRRLKEELQKIADEVMFLDPERPEWKPLLDSRRVVGTVLVLENLFPDLKIPPDKLVKKGGYNDVDVAADDILRRHRQLAAEAAQKKKVRK
jgi:hypothetical protein